LIYVVRLLWSFNATHNKTQNTWACDMRSYDFLFYGKLWLLLNSHNNLIWLHIRTENVQWFICCFVRCFADILSDILSDICLMCCLMWCLMFCQTFVRCFVRYCVWCFVRCCVRYGVWCFVRCVVRCFVWCFVRCLSDVL